MTDALKDGTTAPADQMSLPEVGYRLIRRWVPNVSAEAFKIEAHRQSLAVANHRHEMDDQAFVNSISDLPDR